MSEFVDLSRHLADQRVEDVLDDVLDLVLARVEGSAWAGVLELPATGVPGLTVVTSPVSARAAAAEVDAREGPSSQAARTGRPVASGDLTRETRWPTYVGAALATSPVRSVLSMPVAARPATVLSVWSDRPGVMDTPLAEGSTRLLAELTGMLLLHAGAEGRAASLVDALDSSRQLGVAQGLLMARYDLDERHAHDLLLGVSVTTGLSVADVVTFLVLTRSLPGLTDDDASPPRHA